MKKIKVLAPDIDSGLDFLRVFNETLANLKADFRGELSKINISPRVNGSELTSNPQQISDQLYKIILDLIDKDYKNITIACNSLSLPIFSQKSRKLILKSHQKINLITTFETINAYANKFNNKALLIGTKPWSKYMRDYQPSNICLSEDIHLDLVQEIIWRIKSLQNSDISTSIQYIDLKNVDENKHKIIDLTKTLVETIYNLNFKDVIMGCTEIPAAISMLNKKDLLDLNFIDPARLVAEEFYKI